jgi:hypothetical protein
MEAKINVAAILKDKLENTKLYSPLFGDVYFYYVGDDLIKVTHHGGRIVIFFDDGRYYNYPKSEPLLFPSKEMRDWSKFAWKRGDVLVTEDGSTKVIFECFEDDTYLTFKGKYCLQKTNIDETFIVDTNGNLTECFSLQDKNIAQIYLYNIEDRIGGRLNMETLEIEKPKKPKKKPVFELGGLYVFNDEDEDGELTIIGKLIGKNEIEDTLTFGNQYEIGNEKFVADQAFDLRISVHEELRKATEGEAITFQEAYAIWEKSKKRSAFKPFDKVLVRDSESDKWRANLFGYIDNGEYYHCVFANWVYCIPYNEETAHLLGTTDEWKGGER